MTHQEGSCRVGAVPARSADTRSTRSQSSLIARLSQEEVRATTAEAENTWPWATHPAAAQVPHRTAEQKAQVGPQLSPGLATAAGVPHSVVPSEQDPDIQRRYPTSHKQGPARRRAAKQQPAAPQGNAQRGATWTPPVPPPTRHPLRRPWLSSTPQPAAPAPCPPCTCTTAQPSHFFFFLHSRRTAPQRTIQQPPPKEPSYSIQSWQPQGRISLPHSGVQARGVAATVPCGGAARCRGIPITPRISASEASANASTGCWCW
jgi:hypothetical protein